MLKDYKISSFSHNVSALPDYPSGSYTARQLKEYFDGNSGEIKTKYNALIDELITKFGLVGVDIADAVENHNQDEAAHEKIIEPMREQISDILLELLSMNIAIESKADGLETANQLGALDLLLTGITIELQNHTGARNNPHEVTADQVGLDKVNNTPDNEKNVASAKKDSLGNIIHETYATKDEVGDVDLSGYYTKAEIDSFRIADEMNMERHVGVRIDETLGDISSALEELHEYAQNLVGGDA